MGLLARYSGDQIRRSVGVIKRGVAAGSASSELSLDDLPVSVRAVQASAASAEDDDDPELSAYNAYLARLNAEVKDHGRWHGWRS